MVMWQILGGCLIALPFVVISTMMVKDGGWVPMLVAWGSVAAITACIVGGLYLVSLS